MNIIEEKENFLLNRKEVKVIAEAGKNPSFADAVKILAEKFKVDENSIHVDAIKGKFGRNTFLISGMIYKTAEEKESQHMKKEKLSLKRKPSRKELEVKKEAEKKKK